MDVLFLAHSYPRHEGDLAGSFLLRLAQALRGEDVRVRVVAPAAPDLPDYEELGGIPVHRYRYAPRRYETLAYGGNMAALVRASWSARLALVGFMGASFRRAVQVRREHRPQLVHAHWWFPGGVVGSWLSGLAHLPLVTTMHGTDLRIARDVAIARAPFRRVMQASAEVTAVSSWLAGEAATLMPEGRRPVVAPMPVATELFSSDGAARGDGLLFVGRLTEQKGVDKLLHALAQQRAPARLDVVGDGPEADALRTLAGELGLADRVRWHGALPQDRLPEHYQRAAALVVPSRDEGLGLVAVEAMLSGTPVVAFDSGGLRDLVQHDRTGVLVPQDDVRALAASLDELLDDGAAERRTRLGEAGRLFALGAFSPESAARRYAGIYRAALGARPT
ncbi:MAG TPA: glycosyltransferase family 4 protein [Gemmatimonadaceae bacterium]|jgi:glycosyltransferase involved in cell wall biosynthesis